MSIKIVRAKGLENLSKGPLVVLVGGGPKGDEQVPGLGEALRAPLGAGALDDSRLARLASFEGGRRVLYLRLGAAEGLDTKVLRRAGAATAAFARECKSSRVGLCVAGFGSLSDDSAGRALAEGLVLGAYVFRGTKTDKAPAAVQQVHVVIGEKTGPQFVKGLEVGRTVGEAQCLARDLGNLPANLGNPAHLAATARKIAKDTGVRCKVLGMAELKKGGYGGLLAVNAGSDLAPCFLELEYRPPKHKSTVCLIGKGLTFDTGGISIKPAAGMEEMKFDMCGGAAVLGAFQAIGALKPKNVRVVGYVPVTENMPSGKAIKPGDVLTTYGGITVEVTNTDAEGRLVLADALGRARELKADYTIDLATLTGACVVALGHRASGMFCADDDLRAKLESASKEAGEPIWPLPPWDEYGDDMKSTVADIKNSGPRWGGACTAYAFLKKFAGDLRWAHLDIAGTAWDMPKDETYENGATGICVRSLVALVESLS